MRQSIGTLEKTNKGCAQGMTRIYLFLHSRPRNRYTLKLETVRTMHNMPSKAVSPVLRYCETMFAS